MTGRPIPDQLAFEEPTMVLKRQKKDTPFTPATPLTPPATPPATPPTSNPFEEAVIIATPSTPLVCPKAPSKTPLRSPARTQYTDMSSKPLVTKISINEKAINSSGGGGIDPNFHGVHFLTQRKRAKSSSTHFQYLVKLGEGCFGEVWKAKSFLDDHLYAMELCEKGSLKDKLNQTDGAIDETLLWNYIADISRGLEHVHSNGIIHLDIKPENLLFSNEGSLKICDFGVSVTNGDTEGDQIYMAPELLDENYTQSADIFSFGITIYECITGYQLPSQGQWWRNLREGNIPFPQNISISNDLKDLISSMMSSDPLKRINILGILNLPKVKEILEIKKKSEQPNPRLRLQRKLF
ncbi:putative protein tyrosine kinase [Heterostelium album PN500]|uniref:Protein kinase domain-containing protein n=1 Tax=Heterostelium pallidum (strain ATCC 26659 / Pp 5 / PN500) TaxID=670386 RepID=D3B5K5_HETP5|nr:putative protein tyrosine kinase [Heterostelium album PN500]EFA83153.1 putative protein tyrosine kinase [Heterostelium album PN500]|eukprot:XP_020435270.1 putative protein tyrosine kinase [Heterostelium album PN500]